MDRYQEILKRFGMKASGKTQEELDQRLLFFVKSIVEPGLKEKEELEWQAKSHLKSCFVAWETPISICDEEIFRKVADLNDDNEMFEDFWLPRLRLAYVRNSEGIKKFFYYDGDLTLKEIQGTNNPNIQLLLDKALDVAPEEQKIKALFDEKKKMDLVSKGLYKILVSFIDKVQEADFGDKLTERLIEENLKIIEEKTNGVI